jgi:hypothetical protein
MTTRRGFLTAVGGWLAALGLGSVANIAAPRLEPATCSNYPLDRPATYDAISEWLREQPNVRELLLGEAHFNAYEESLPPWFRFWMAGSRYPSWRGPIKQWGPRESQVAVMFKLPHEPDSTPQDAYWLPRTKSMDHLHAWKTDFLREARLRMEESKRQLKADIVANRLLKEATASVKLDVAITRALATI